MTLTSRPVFLGPWSSPPMRYTKSALVAMVWSWREWLAHLGQSEATR